MRIATLPIVVAVAIILSTPPVPVGAQGCCQGLGIGVCVAPAADNFDFQCAFFPDAVCNAATGECGVLMAAGNCCEAFSLCFGGPNLTPVNCQDAGGTFFLDVACTPRGSCSTEFCGDGVLQTGLGEKCDDGNNDDGDGCSFDCLFEAGGVPILPQEGLILFAALLLGTSFWLIERRLRT